MRRTVISLLGLALMAGALGAIGCAKKEAAPATKPTTPATTPADGAKPTEPAK